MSCVTCAQPLLEAYPNTGAVQEAVNGKRDDGGLNLNDTLEDIGMGKIRTNADTKEVYAASLDGTDVENWIIDLYAALVNADESHLLEEDWGLMKSKSKFLRGVANTYKTLSEKSTVGKAGYALLKKALPVLRHWAAGMRLALAYKPRTEDYDKVKEELALYFSSKMLLWPESNTWYDNECLYTFGAMHAKWGSLRLVSQEGMEAWQKKLNEVLRLGNGFANAGAIPKDVKEAGQAAVDAYMIKRKDAIPSSAQWVYEQAMLQQHAYTHDVLSARDELRREGKLIEWADFVDYWRRYMVCAAMRCRLRARSRRGVGGAVVSGKYVLKQQRPAPAGNLYAKLLADHKAYWASVDEYLTAEDLGDMEKARQQRRLRRLRFCGVELEKGMGAWNA